MAYRAPLQEITKDDQNQSNINNIKTMKKMSACGDDIHTSFNDNHHEDSNTNHKYNNNNNNNNNSNNNNNNINNKHIKPSRFVFHPDVKALGSGAYGTVYPAFDRLLNRNVAIKVIKPQSAGALLCPTTIREIGLLKSTTHKNIITLLDMKHEPRSSTIYLVFERAHYDLKKFWNKYYKKNNFAFNPNRGSQIITIPLIKHIMIQIISAISFLHSVKTIHRDIKPQHILLFLCPASNGNGYKYRIKLADFGLARGYNQPNLSLTTEVVTLWYRPIELLLGCGEYDKSVDVWAIGCVLYELITNQPLFPGTSQIETIFKIFQLLGTPPKYSRDAQAVESLRYYQPRFPQFSRTPWLNTHIAFNDIDSNVTKLLNKLMCLDPKQRISSSNALKHPFLAS